MNEVWILTLEPDYEEGRILGVFTSPKAAQQGWYEETGGNPMPPPNAEGNYADHGLCFRLTRHDVIA